MGLIEAVIRALIYICVVAIAFYLIVYVLGAIGIVLPAMVVKILWVIGALICLLVLLRLLWPPLSGMTWWPPAGPPPRA